MFMKMSDYMDRVRGCWMGKNIGGTLGAPFECRRGVIDLDGYTQDMSNGAPPNDDLDLQLVWLNAAERYGRSVDAHILGNYWSEYVVANFSEYGAGKNNLEMGVLPPLSGWYNNHNRTSCGAFIRSEIWACLLPGHPELAARYAYEDASVDHAGEGVYAEVFTASLQSAAFCIDDARTLLDIALSYIPGDCGVALAVNTAIQCFDSGIDWKAARKKILQAVPSSFGMYEGYCGQVPEPDVPVGTPGYDVPSNIGIFVLGLLYGKGDFGRSICTAAGCMEDADCTAATLGALLGIMHGASAIPEKWRAPIGDQIKTVCINLTRNLPVPNTVTELSQRVCALLPTFLPDAYDGMDAGGPRVELLEPDALYCRDHRVGQFLEENFRDSLSRCGITMQNVSLKATLSCPDGIRLRTGEPLRLRLHLTNLVRRQQWVSIRMWMPAEWTSSCGTHFTINLDQPHGGFATAECELSITPEMATSASETVVFEFRSLGRPAFLYIPLTLVNDPQSTRAQTGMPQ